MILRHEAGSKTLRRSCESPTEGARGAVQMGCKRAARGLQAG
jgi:hypothetical protein